MDYGGDAISDQEWGQADADYLDQMLDAGPDDEPAEDEDWNFEETS